MALTERTESPKEYFQGYVKARLNIAAVLQILSVRFFISHFHQVTDV